MAAILMTMNEDTGASSARRFAVTYKVDEHDCLAYAEALAERGHAVYFVNWQDFRGDGFARMYAYADERFVAPLPLAAIDLAWIYQMEGFYAEIDRFLQLVAACEVSCRTVINDPRTIRHNLGKQYLWALAARGVRVIPTFRVDGRLLQRLAAGERFILKPVYGERGGGVFLACAPADLEGIAGRAHEYIAQSFVPEIRAGEKSLVYLGREYQHAVLKRPCGARPQEFRCNESLGGSVSVYEPTAAELAYARSVLDAYRSLGCAVHYSRVDFVDTPAGPALMEAELLNPAAFANYSGKGAAFARAVAGYLEALMARTAAPADSVGSPHVRSAARMPQSARA